MVSCTREGKYYYWGPDRKEEGTDVGKERPRSALLPLSLCPPMHATSVMPLKCSYEKFLLFEHSKILLCLGIHIKVLVLYVRPSTSKYLPVCPAFGYTMFSLSHAPPSPSSTQISPGGNFCLLNVTGSAIHRCSTYSLNAKSTALTQLTIFTALFTSSKSFQTPCWNILPSYSRCALYVIRS